MITTGRINGTIPNYLFENGAFMQYKCGVCGQTITGDSIAFIDHNEQHIADLIKSKHPNWQEKDGVCSKCLEHYRSQLKGESTVS